MSNYILPFRLQFFAADDGGAGTGAGQGSGNDGQGAGQSAGQGAGRPAAEFDYDRLAKIVGGQTAAKEDAVLKGYFKQQGLSKEDAEAAMQKFKEEKAAQQPDVAGIEAKLAEAQAAAQAAALESAATLEAVGLGIDAKTMPYLLKMADLSPAIDQEGKINKETVKKAIEKVLEDVPQLKPTPNNQSGFQVGGGGGDNSGADNDAVRAAFGLGKG